MSTTELQETSTPTPAPGPAGSGALIAGIIGAVLVLAGFLAGSFAAREVLRSGVIYSNILHIVTYLLGVTAGIFAVSRVLTNPPSGTRGAIFLVLSTVITVVLVTRGIGILFAQASFGMFLTVAVLAVLSFLGYRFLTSRKAQNWMTSLEEQGWFHFHSYKKTQGLILRRFTLVGILLIGGAGAWSLWEHQSFTRGDWMLTIPYTTFSVPLIPSLSIVGPLLIATATLWIGLRLINTPSFGDFLIATEAEMNKVSWSTRKRLTQDTIVVLVTVLLITLFLLIVDLFWGWFLSLKYIEVLPKRQDTKNVIQDSTGNRKTDW
jgi:preprotein translocase SecE subunit